MAYGTRVNFEELRTAAFGAIGAAYTAIGGPTMHHCRLVSIFNSTNVDVIISLDGATAQMRIAGGTGQVLDLSTNKIRDDGLFLHSGTTFWVKDDGVAPGIGNVWVQVLYAEGGV